MVDLFPSFTAFLQALLFYLMFVGFILAAISGVGVGILFMPLPLLGDSEERQRRAMVALRGVVIGILIIVLAIPARNAVLRYFPLPVNLPSIPLTTPVITPTVTPR